MLEIVLTEKNNIYKIFGSSHESRCKMVSSVIPIKNGFIYQSLYFWKNALKLLDDSSGIQSVSFELDGAKSFDDIVVEYINEKFTSSGDVKKRFFQVKYHEYKKQTIKAEDLITPSFINATVKSFLQKAKEAIESSDENIEIILLNAWDLHQDDVLYKLISRDDGSFDIKKLKEGKTSQSLTGKIRIEWAQHLDVSEEELCCLLRRVKIQEGKSIQSLIEELNVSLKSFGLKKIDEDSYRDSTYLSLIEDLHAKIKDGVVLDKSSLLSHLKRKDMFTTFLPSSYSKLGIRSFVAGAENLEKNVNEFLDFSVHFTDCRICDYNIWNTEIKNGIESFVSENIKPGLGYSVYLEAHQTIAFTIGYFAHQKTGKYLYPIQKGYNSEIWEYSEENIYPSVELRSDINLVEDSEFVIINIDLMNINLKDHIREFVNEKYPDSKVAIIDIYPLNPQSRFVKDGNHCMKLASEVSEMLLKMPFAVKRKEWWFAFTAPNSFVMFLGQLSTQFGHIQLLEFDRDDFSYEKSILL